MHCLLSASPLHTPFSQNPGDAIHTFPWQAEAACSEMLRMLSEFLPTEYPDFFRKEGSILTALKTGETFDLDNLGMDALEASARLVQVHTQIVTQLGIFNFVVDCLHLMQIRILGNWIKDCSLIYLRSLADWLKMSNLHLSVCLCLALHVKHGGKTRHHQLHRSMQC